MKKHSKFCALLICTALGFSVSLESCKDYDDDIDHLQEQINETKTAIANLEEAIESGKWVSNFEKTDKGYRLTLSDGSKLELLNGDKGDKGDKGDTGLTGPEGPIGAQGEKGESVIPEFRVDTEGYWQYNVGGEWISVEDQEGNKIKAQGEKGEPGSAGGNNVFFNEDGFIQIGDKVTDLKKKNPNIPTMVVDNENGTLAITWENKTYIMLLADSEYDGFQSLVYRRQTTNDRADFVKAWSLYYEKKDGKIDTFAFSPAIAQFKVLPKNIDVVKAEKDKKISYNFVDTRLVTKAANAPILNYVENSAKLENGILSVSFTPENVISGKRYVSSLEVTLNGKIATSDYFNYKSTALDASEATVRVQSHKACEVTKEQVNKMLAETVEHNYHYKFVYTETYALNDSIALCLSDDDDIYYTFAELGFGEHVEVSYAMTEGKDKGIFDLTEDGVISVKKEKQGSAIKEFCYVTVTYTILDADKTTLFTVERDLAIQAVRAEDMILEKVEIVPVESNALNMAYEPNEARAIVLDVRKFEDAIGGRDIINSTNTKDESKIWKLGYFDEENKLQVVAVTQLPNVETAPNSNKVAGELGEKEMALYFKAGDKDENVTSEDSLFLLVGPKAYFGEEVNTRAYFAVEDDDLAKVGRENKYFNFFLNASIEKTIQVTPYSALVDGNGNAKVRGLWDENLQFTMTANLTNYYKVTPSDIKLVFKLAPKDEQPAAVQKVYDLLAINETAKGYIFEATPKKDRPIDVEAVKDIEVYAYNSEDETDVLVNNLKLQLVSPLGKIWVATSPAQPVEIKNNGGTDITKEMKNIIKPSLEDKYELENTTKGPQKVIIDGDIQKQFKIEFNLLTYGVQDLIYEISNKAELDAALGEGTVKIDAGSGELTIKDTQTAFTATTIVIAIKCKHSWGNSDLVGGFKYTIVRK